MTKIYKIKDIPKDSLITKNLSSIDYYDSYMIIKENKDSVEKIAEKILTLPNWIKIALRIRFYLIVKPFNLSTGRYDQTMISLEANVNQVPILEKNENEIVLGSNDKHLDYRISIMKKEAEQKTQIYLNTIVKFNNILGRIYFLPVRLGHKLVVRSLLKR